MTTCKWTSEYSMDQKILIVGNGDFSFSHALTETIKSGSNLIATSLDTYEVTNKYEKAKVHIKNLADLGATILHGVDATALESNPNLMGKKFDRVIFNFPHSGFKKGGESKKRVIKNHKNLVIEFFKNAVTMLSEEGEVNVTYKTKKPYNLWGIEELAVEASLVLTECADFHIEEYPGYQNKRGDGVEADNQIFLAESSKFKFIINKA